MLQLNFLFLLTLLTMCGRQNNPNKDLIDTAQAGNNSNSNNNTPSSSTNSGNAANSPTGESGSTTAGGGGSSAPAVVTPSPILALCDWNKNTTAGAKNTFQSLPSFVDPNKIFYISTTDGDDNRTAEQAKNPATPWKTLEKVKTYIDTLNNGQRARTAFLFKRGDVFEGGDVLFDYRTQHSTENMMYFGSYGTNTQKPVLTGSVRLNPNAWQATTLNGLPVFYYEISGYIPQLIWINGERKHSARFPRTGWGEIQSVSTTSSSYTITTSTTLPILSLVNAFVHYRAKLFAYETVKVTNHTGNTLTTDRPIHTSHYSPLTTSGFFIDRHKNLILERGDWAFDETENRIYFYPPEGFNFDNNEIRALRYNTAFNGNYHAYGLVFHDLTFQHYRNAALKMLPMNRDPNVSGSVNRVVQVVNCVFKDILGLGIDWEGGDTGTEVRDSTFEDLYNGLSIRLGTVVIENNLFNRVGMTPGLTDCTPSYRGMMAIALELTRDSVVRSNVFLENGGTSIAGVGAKNLLIEKNNFSHVVKFMGDNGVIHPWGQTVGLTENWTIRHNAFCHGFSSTEGLSGEQHLNTFVYLDNRTTGASVYENVMIGTESLRQLVFSNTGGTNHRVFNNFLFQASNQPRRIFMIHGDMGGITEPTNDIEYYSNTVIQGHESGGIYHTIRRNDTSFSLYNNRYYHRGLGYFESSQSDKPWGFEGYADFTGTQERGSHFYPFFERCPTSEEELIAHYTFPINQGRFLSNGSQITRNVETDHILFTVNANQSGSIVEASSNTVLADRTYRVEYELEVPSTAVALLEIIHKTRKDGVDGYPTLFPFHRIKNRQVRSYFFQYNPVTKPDELWFWLKIDASMLNTDYPVKLYSLKLYRYPRSCLSASPLDPYRVVVNNTSTTQTYALNTTYRLLDTMMPVTSLTIPAGEYRVLTLNRDENTIERISIPE